MDCGGRTGSPRPQPLGARGSAHTAVRAQEFKWALEIKQSSKLCVRFRQAGEGVGTPDWGVGPVLYGSVAEWICQERKGLRKYENFKLLRAAAAPVTLDTAAIAPIVGLKTEQCEAFLPA